FGSAYSLPGAWMGALGIQLTNQARNGYFAEDGQVKNYAVDERYKLFMKYVADLYSNGLINTNAVTNDYSMFPKIPYQLYIGQPMFSPKSSIISL
ncbi:hypothetical protein, partial [Dubosiella newyorkensis]|uniref:hypothetical protein n=1 Tax=Dubosiella newyorkensis TaxID=1862672 RepID=UPI003EBEBF14